MSVPNVSSISERGGKSPFLQRWLKVHQSFKLFELSVIYISGRNLVRLSGYEEISCFKFNSVSYDQKKTEGNYVYTCKPDQSILRRKMCTFWFPFTKKKKKKKKNLFHRGNRWNILWLCQIPGSSLIFDSNLMICKLDDGEAKFRRPDQGSHGCPRFFLCSLFSRTCFKRFCLCFFSIFLHTWLIER